MASLDEVGRAALPSAGECDRASRPFLAAAGGLAIALVAGCLFVASREWFSQEDFAFLARCQRPEAWSWGDIFLPLSGGYWFSYRPLSQETFFYLNFALFGLNATPYFAIALLVHFASAALVYRLGRQLGFSQTIALASALFAASRYPSLASIFRGAMFIYVAPVFFSLLTLSFFLDYTRTGKGRRQAASCAALALGLLSNEYVASLPLVLFALAMLEGPLSARALWRALGRSGPQIALAAVYVGYRLGAVELTRAHPFYELGLGWHTLSNLWSQLSFVFGGAPQLIGAVVVGAAIVTSAATSGNLPGRTFEGFRRVSALCAVWIAAVIVLFSLFPSPSPRWSITIEAPICLALGACLELLWRTHAGRMRRTLEATLLLLVLASIPYPTLFARASDPRGAYPRQLVEVLNADYPGLTQTTVLVLYGLPGLADNAEAQELRRLSYGGALLQAVYPNRQLKLAFRDLSLHPADEVACEPCVYLDLLPGIRLQVSQQLPRR